MNIAIQPGESYKVELVTFIDGHSSIHVTVGETVPAWPKNPDVISVAPLAEGVAPMPEKDWVTMGAPGAGQG